MQSLRQIFESVKLALKTKQINELQVTTTRDQVEKTKEIASIRKSLPDLAEALALQWGHKEFYQFIQKIMDGQQVGALKFANLSPMILQQLGGLTALHIRSSEPGMAVEKKIDTNKWSPEYEFNFIKGARAK